jgi:hypothetical protein
MFDFYNSGRYQEQELKAYGGTQAVVSNVSKYNAINGGGALKAMSAAFRHGRCVSKVGRSTRTSLKRGGLAQMI